MTNLEIIQNREKEDDLMYRMFDANTACECAFYILKGMKVDNQRLKAGREWVGKEVNKARGALLYSKDPQAPSRILEAFLTVDEAIAQNRTLRQIREAFDLREDEGEMISEKIELLNRWSEGESEAEVSTAVLVFSRFVTRDSKNALKAVDK